MIRDLLGIVTPRTTTTRLRAVALWAFLQVCAVLPAHAGEQASTDSLLAGASQPARQRPLHTITRNEGLPDAVITSVAQDGAGFLWVGTTNGLARWDGYSFQHHTADGRPGSLGRNAIASLHGDRQGRLWVGTMGSGLFRHDEDSDRFVAYPFPEGSKGGSRYIIAIADGADGALLVSTAGGLFRLEKATDRLTPVLLDTAAFARDWRRPRGVEQDGSGTLFQIAGDKVFSIDSAHRVAKVDFEGMQGNDPYPLNLVRDSADRIWITTARAGVFVIDPRGSTAHVIIPPAATIDGLVQTEAVVDVVEARPGQMWLDTAGGSILSLEVATGELHRVRASGSMSALWGDDGYRTLFRDRAGLVWAADELGLSVYDPAPAHVMSLEGAPACRITAGCEGRVVSPLAYIESVMAGADGTTWLADQDQIEIVDRSGVGLRTLRPAQPGMRFSGAPAMRTGPDGQVYIATFNGVYRAAADGSHAERITIKGRQADAATRSLLLDGDTLWIGGESDGLWRMDLRTGLSGAVAGAAAEGQPVGVYAMAASRDHSLWVWTLQSGLSRYEIGRGRWQHFPQAPAGPPRIRVNAAAALFVDSQDRLWIGTAGAGLAVLPPGGGAAPFSFVRIAAAPGLAGDNIDAITQDIAGRIWVSTDDGLAMVDPATLEVRRLGAADHVQWKDYFSNAVSRDASGKVYFGGVGGITIVDAAHFEPWSFTAPLVVTSLRVSNVPLPATRLVARPGATAGRVDVPAGGSVSVEFSALDFSAPYSNRYAWRLDDETAWTETDPGHRVAAYANLPPGEHRLHVRASNRTGLWSGLELAIDMHFAPFWYQTVAARAAGAVGAVLLVWAIVQLRTRWLRRRQAILESTVEARTAELRTLATTLQARSEELATASVTDPLTGLRNRRYVTENIGDAVAATYRRRAGDEAARNGSDADMTVFLIDIDHFKSVNDRHGHGGGDAVLAQFAKRLERVVRASDFLVRWGGEEFMIVARDADRRQASTLAERIRQVVAGDPFVLDDGVQLDVTCSIGFVSLPFALSPTKDFDWHQAVMAADLALYEAKASGRNAWIGLEEVDISKTVDMSGSVEQALQEALRAGRVHTLRSRPLPATAG